MSRDAAALCLVACLLTVAMAWPVLEAPASRLFGDDIVGRHEAPFIVAHQFENVRAPGLYTQPATDYPGAALAAMTGNGIVALNLLTLASFPLAALFGYLLTHRLTRSRPAAWLAGLLYAFAPFHLAQAAYHPHGAQTQWLPLYLLALWLCLERADRPRLALLGLSLALVALSNFYYGLMVAVLTPFALVGFWWAQNRSAAPARGTRRTLLALGALAAAGLLYVLAVAPAALDRRDQLAFPRSDLELYGARWSSYLTPPVGHPIAGEWVEDVWERRGPGGMLEQQITVGFGLLLLAGVALVSSLGRDRKRELAATPALALLASVAFAVSLAPPVGGWSPSVLIYELLPMFRAYARFSLVVFLALAIMASVSVTRLIRAGAPWRVVALGLLGLTITELTPLPPWRWRDILPTTAHRFLDDRSDPVRVIDCAPHHVLGENPAFQRFKHSLSLPVGNADCGDPGFAHRAASEGFTHLLVRRPSPLGEWLTRRDAGLGGAPVGRFDDALLFELTAPVQPLPHVSFDRGFHWREYLGDETYRWMGQSATLEIVNPAGSEVPLALALKLHAFPGPRDLEISIDGYSLGRFQVSTEPTSYTLPEIALAPGRHRLTLLALSPAVTADSVLHNGDARELTVALWDWTANPHRPSLE